jgi:hypothetical protein
MALCNYKVRTYIRYYTVLAGMARDNGFFLDGSFFNNLIINFLLQPVQVVLGNVKVALLFNSISSYKVATCFYITFLIKIWKICVRVRVRCES